ncbi:MAG: hypothetical protein G01um101438_37 [Parcubacteria group bacterium Gr01-1014_38]|nr:MAG: hypothetical protein G01um101438_37 [Parcubacteria group bacterium Gr01-1014_38]
MRSTLTSQGISSFLGGVLACIGLFMFVPTASAHETSGDRLRALSNFEDSKGGPENVAEAERRLILHGRTPRVIGAATEATAARVAAPSKDARHVLSNFEDARGGKENVAETERRAVLRGSVPRVKGISMAAGGAGIQSLRGEITELTPTFVEVWYKDVSGNDVRRKFALTASTVMRAHLQRGDQVEVRFALEGWIALMVRDLAPPGEEARFGANNCAECPGEPM